jgi:hypothetical protein
MKIVQLPFHKNPAEFAASYTFSSGFNPEKTLVITPTERFKSYFASEMLKFNKGELLAPNLTTSGQIVKSLVAGLGLLIANEVERLSMLYKACFSTRDVQELLPKTFLSSFSTFRPNAGRILRSFDELNREMLDLTDVQPTELVDQTYSHFDTHFRTFRDLLISYSSIQKEEGLYDQSFLLKDVKRDHIQDYFQEFSVVLFVSPVSLNRFETLLYQQIEYKLTVISQNSDDYDFSRVLSYREQRSPPSQPTRRNGHSKRNGDSKRNVHCYDVSSRMDQVMLVLSILKEQIDAGVPLQKIAVLNLDSLFSEMLYDSLRSLGIDVNYSEGLRVKKSPVYSLLQLAASFFQSRYDAGIFLEILQNPLFQEMAGSKIDHFSFAKIKQRIISRRVFHLPSIRSGFIEGDANTEAAFLVLERLYRTKSFTKLYDELCVLFSRMRSRKSYDYYAVREILLNSAVELEELQINTHEKPFVILLEYVASRRYPLTGNYSEGVQVIGLLESRGIAFTKVIVPSFNEGFFPVQGENDMFFDLNLRRILKLPTFLDQENLQFYYLKRVVESASDSYLVSIIDPSGEIGVKSRFYYCFPEVNMEKVNHRRSYVLPVRSKQAGPQMRTVSHPSLRRTLDEFSRLDTDLIKKCEVRYFIARMLNITDSRTIDTGIEKDLVGLKIHSLFSELYSEVDFDNIAENSHVYELRLDELFEKHFVEGLFYTREEILLKKILRNNLLKALRADLVRFREGHRVCGEFMERELSADIAGGYRLKGRIDRVDRTPSGGYRVIDYKTGKLPGRVAHLAAKQFQEVQLGFYGLLFKKNFPEAWIDALCYYDLLEKKDIEIIIDSENIDGYLESFETHLFQFYEELNHKEELSLTGDYANCTYCSFFNICRVLEV